MNTFGFCPFRSIENNVLLAQVIRLYICLSFSSAFMIVGLKEKLLSLSKDFWAGTDYMFLIKNLDSSNAVHAGLFLTHLLGKGPFIVAFMF